MFEFDRKGGGTGEFQLDGKGKRLALLPVTHRSLNEPRRKKTAEETGSEASQDK